MGSWAGAGNMGRGAYERNGGVFSLNGAFMSHPCDMRTSKSA